MNAKEKSNVALSALALVGTIVLFALGRVEAAGVVMAFLSGHLLPSPIPASNGGADPS